MATADLQEADDSSGTRISYQHHARKLLLALNETRKNPDLCDAFVSIGNVEIPVQKSVLSAASQYLRALFSYDGNLSWHAGKSCIRLDNLHVSAEIFRSILNYVYTSEITLSPDNIQDILQAADLLLLTDLKNMCCEYLEGCISSHNCIGIRDFTARLSCPWIHLKVTQFLDENIREASYSEEFLRMSPEDVEMLLVRDTIQLRCEEDVLDSIIRWCRWDVTSRRSQLAVLVNSCVRVGLLTDPSLSRLKQDDPSGDIVAVVAPVIEAKRQQLQQEGESEKLRGQQLVVVACGGEGQVNEASDESEMKATCRFVRLHKAMSSSESKWFDLAPMLTPRSGHGVVEVGGYIYAIGGRDNQCCILNTGEKYDPCTNTWTAIAPMEHGRVGYGLVAVDDNIYALGGSNDMTDPLASMEVYNIFTNKWRSLPDMTLKRVWCAFAAADKKIYVMAGGIVGKFYEAVECFDTRTESWLSVSPMRERRCDARAVAVENDIYVFGGFRRLECPSAVHSGHSIKFCGAEVYTSKNDYWVPVQSRYGAPGLCTMSESSCLCGAVYDGEEILVVGDLDVGNHYQSVRAFNRHNNSWRCVVETLPKHQQRYQVCLLRMPAATLSRLQVEQTGAQQD